MGDKYNVQKLKNTCHRFLVEEYTDIDNCCKVLVTAYLTYCDILGKECCAFIGENVAEVIKTEGLADMGRTHPKLFKVIIVKNATTWSE
jgi:hypothetical protein